MCCWRAGLASKWHTHKMEAGKHAQACTSSSSFGHFNLWIGSLLYKQKLASCYPIPAPKAMEREHCQLLWALEWLTLPISLSQLHNPFLFTCVTGARRGVDWDGDLIFLGNIQACCGKEFLSDSTYKLSRQHRHMGGGENHKHRGQLAKKSHWACQRQSWAPNFAFLGTKTSLCSTKWVLDSIFSLISQCAPTESVLYRQRVQRWAPCHASSHLFSDISGKAIVWHTKPKLIFGASNFRLYCRGFH